MKKLLALCILPSLAFAHTVSWYGDEFHGRLTASGEPFNQYAFTCASNTHDFNAFLRVTNTANGKSIICRVNDTGGFDKYGRTLDLSKGAFSKLASLEQGVIQVNIQEIE